ncbi:MAG TPA: mechanosensitive ion channel domain-containing protein [bacterium]|nr:mechanosensitive ion channel domain-containing protein [bacterium]
MDPLEPLRQVDRDLLNPQRIASTIEAVIWLAAIAIGAWVVLRLSLGLVRRTAAWRIGHPAGRLQPIVEGLLRYVIIFTAIVLMLAALRVDITPVLASATVLGLTLGFGAQFIIRDLLAGIFLVSEGIIQVGDTVRVDGDVGTVERVTLRFTQIRKFSGELVTMPNGAIAKIGNLSRGYARAIVQVLVPYDANAPTALEALRDAAQAWAASRAADGQAAPTIDGVVDLQDTGAVLQCSVLVAPGQQDGVAAELRRHVLEAMGHRGIVPGAVPFAPSAASPPA